MKLPHGVDALIDPEPLARLSPAATRAATHRLAAGYPNTPLPEIHDELAAVRRSALYWSQDRDHLDGERGDQLTAALACGLYAWARHDLGDTRTALAVAQAGLISAIVDARHPGAEVWLRGVQSLIAYRAGWVHESLHYAQSGLSVQDDEIGTATIWLHSLTALTQAVLGDALAASAALSAGRHVRALSRLDDLDRIGGLLHFGQARQDAYEAQARAFITGSERSTIEYAESAIGAFESGGSPNRSVHDEMSARVAAALAYANLDEIEATAEALRPVLRLDPAWRVDGLRSSMMLVHQRLRRPFRAREARVRELQKDIEGFCQMPLFIDSSA
ncbi:hypothetical protein [Embleya sp. NBC_00896]|uniref:hypothetical protein n=1 Tax=Embleya sp. NBC_00896 TaxID=2975961 RepID=UPI0038658BCA|nr:hypothetical protein OG928_31520 [Embleya sp. NBC_00896]